MWAIAALIAFSIALFIQLADAAKGQFLTPTTFMLAGLICLTLAHVTPGWPRRPPQ